MFGYEKIKKENPNQNLKELTEFVNDLENV